MRQVDVKEIVDLLLGNIEWYGETNHDSDVVRRLDDYEDMVFHIIYKLIDLIKVKHQYQASAKECGNKAYYTLKSIHDFISDYLEEFKEK